MSANEERLKFPLPYKPIWANPFFRKFTTDPNFQTKSVYDVDEVNPIVEQTPEELKELENTKKIDANDLSNEDFRKLVTWAWRVAPRLFISESKRMTLGEMCEAYPDRMPYVIEGLLRRGEIGNLISASKIGKSFLVDNIATCMATGSKLFGKFQCVRGKTLILDNELQKPEIVWRFKQISEALMIPMKMLTNMIEIIPMRGRLRSIFDLSKEFDDVRPGEFKLVILDALYKTLPPRTDENDNGAMAQIYNCLDSFAEYLEAPIIVVHHASKGNQSSKSVRDVGSGAGVLNRACDLHLVLREHEDDNASVMEAICRSSQAPAPMGLRWRFPLWTHDPNVDVTKLRGLAETERAVVDDRRLSSLRKAVSSGLITNDPKGWHAIWSKSKKPPYNLSIGENTFQSLLKSLAEDGMIVLVKNLNGTKEFGYRIRMQEDGPATLNEAAGPVSLNPAIDLDKVIPIDPPQETVADETGPEQEEILGEESPI